MMISGNRNQSAEVEVSTLARTQEIRWQLQTLIALAVSYLFFSVLMLYVYNRSLGIYLAFVPLFLYDTLKVIICSMRICNSAAVDAKESIKDIIESVFMSLYKVCNSLTIT